MHTSMISSGKCKRLMTPRRVEFASWTCSGTMAALWPTDYRDRAAEGPLFRRILKNGKLGTDGLSGTAVRDIVKARCALAGVGDDFSAHSLRSGFVTEAGRQNMPLQETMALTGHRSVETIGGYFRAGAAQVSAVARMMDAHRSQPDPPSRESPS